MKFHLRQENFQARLHHLLDMLCLVLHNSLSSQRGNNLTSNSDIDLLRSICTYFDLPRREEHVADRIMSLTCLAQKSFAKGHFCKKKRYFDLSCPLEPNLLKKVQFWWHAGEIAVKELSIVFLRGLIPIIGSEITEISKQMWWLAKFDLFDFWWRQYCPELKNCRNTSEYTHWEQSKAFSFAFLSLLVLSKGFGHFDPPPQPTHQGEGGWDRHPGAG